MFADEMLQLARSGNVIWHKKVQVESCRKKPLKGWHCNMKSNSQEHDAVHKEDK